VHPPGSEEFESTAVAWLLDVVPPDYRLHGVLRRYPIALAALARYHSKACVEGAREGYRAARTELADALPPHAIDTVLAAYRKEGARLAATARAVGLVERALRGETFTPKMPQQGRPAGPPRRGTGATPDTPQESVRAERPGRNTRSTRTEEPKQGTPIERPGRNTRSTRTEEPKGGTRAEAAPGGHADRAAGPERTSRGVSRGHPDWAASAREQDPVVRVLRQANGVDRLVGRSCGQR
jgi:hypothetical protein